MNIFDIGIILYKCLLGAGCGDRVFPVVAENSTEYPFIIYRRSSTDMNGNKDRNTYSSYYDIMVVSDNYSKAVEVSKKVLELLGNRIIDNMMRITVTNIEEDYAEAFIINFNLKIDI